MEIQHHGDLHDPKEGTKVHNRFDQLAGRSSSSDEQDSSDDNFNSDDDETINAKNAPPPLTFHRSDMKITIKGLTTDHYLDSLKQIQLVKLDQKITKTIKAATLDIETFRDFCEIRRNSW